MPPPSSALSGQVRGREDWERGRRSGSRAGAALDATRSNAAKIAAIALHTAPRLTSEEARRCALIVPCSAVGHSLFGSADFPAPRAGKIHQVIVDNGETDRDRQSGGANSLLAGNLRQYPPCGTTDMPPFSSALIRPYRPCGRRVCRAARALLRCCRAPSDARFPRSASRRAGSRSSTATSTA